MAIWITRLLHGLDGSQVRAQRSPLVVLTVLSLAVLLFAACGSSSSNDGVATLDDEPTATQGSGTPEPNGTEGQSDREASDDQQAMLEYAECMRGQGVEMPDPEFDDEGNAVVEFEAGGEGDIVAGPASEEFEEAHEACAQHLEGVNFNLSEEDQQEMQDAMLEFAKCMREHGVDMPDPEPMTPGVPQQAEPLTLDSDNPEVKVAMEACEPILRDAMENDGEGQP